MRYRKLIERYKNNQLNEEDRLQVELDIERQDAISEYLTEKLEEELDASREAFREKGEKNAGETENSVRDKEFETYVRKTVRRSFRKMGIAMLAVLLGIMLFIQFGLSPLITRLYYNPGKEIAVYDADGYRCTITNQMSRDLAIYSEVSLPGKKRDSVRTIPLGYGKYAVTLNKTVTYAGTRRYGIGGQIARGKLELYDPDYLSQPSPNLFACYGLKEEEGLSYREQLEEQKKKGEFTWYYSELDNGREAVEDLEAGKLYQAYVTTNRRMGFSEMYDFVKRMYAEEMACSGEIWLGVCVSKDNYLQRLAGYNYSLNEDSLVLTEEEKENYPELSLAGMGEDGWIDREVYDAKLNNEKTMETHFTSMLQYIADQEEFLRMTGAASGEFMGKDGLEYAKMFYSNAIKYIEENGLSYYGAVCLADREGMLKMLDDKDILSVVALECE